jgi:hypothetical protein
MKNWWSRIRIRLSDWIRNKAAGSKVKRFKSLQEMDAWIDKYGTTLCHWGILRYDILSPLILSCIITPETSDELLASYSVDGNLRDMLNKLKLHYGKWCRDGAGFNDLEGALAGVEVTQEDYYWVLDDGQQKHFVTGVSPLQVRESIRDNIKRYSYI